MNRRTFGKAIFEVLAALGLRRSGIGKTLFMPEESTPATPSIEHVVPQYMRDVLNSDENELWAAAGDDYDTIGISFTGTPFHDFLLVESKAYFPSYEKYLKEGE